MDRELDVVTVQFHILSHRPEYGYELNAFLGGGNKVDPVGVPCANAQRPIPRATNRDGRVRPLDGLWLTRGIVELIVVTVEGGPRFAPQKLNDLHCFLK